MAPFPVTQPEAGDPRDLPTATVLCKAKHSLHGRTSVSQPRRTALDPPGSGGRNTNDLLIFCKVLFCPLNKYVS
jgi:hypothetical protein